MKLIDKPVTKGQLVEIAKINYGGLIKAVVDINKKIMVVDASLHADEEAFLIEIGSKQEDLWGINIYPNLEREEMVEFDSMINLRPNRGNNSRGVDDEPTRKTILEVVNGLIK